MVTRSKLDCRGEKLLSIEKLLLSLWLQLVIQPNLSLILNGVKAELTSNRERKIQDLKLS